jgi:putative DNA primase/helicase
MMARGQRNPGNSAAAGLPVWFNQVYLNDKGAPLPLLVNAIVALEHDPVFAGALRFDRFRSEAMMCRPVPWDPHLSAPRPWSNRDRREACSWLQEHHVRVGELIAESAALTVADRHPFHPVVDYLGGLTWDGVRRIDTWLHTYLGADLNRYIEAVGPRWLISAIARIDRPGCKADCALVLEGPEGIYKSTTFEVMGAPWYSNDIAALGTKDSQQQLPGKWIIELDELDAVSRASDWAAVKAFISRGTDHYRRSYRRDPEDLPRQNVFGGTTNSDTWARDATGLRRFWPVVCHNIDIAALRHDKDQLWAEARDAYFTLAQPWWLDDEELIAVARDQQLARYDIDPWENKIRDFLYGKKVITSSEILDAIGLPEKDRKRGDQMRIGNILRALGNV